MIVALHSGGIDSTVLLYDLLAQGHDVRTVGFDYGQRHRRELEVAEELAGELGVVFHRLTLPTLHGSMLTGDGGDVVVPNRNMIMLAMAGSVAMREKAEQVAIACHAGDYALFPDCRVPFLDAASQALMAATDRRVRILRPYVYMSKIEVVRRGMTLGVPFERTWSCYEGGVEPCGECLACRERRQALAVAGVVV